jgi:hypothetical protein
LDVKVWFLAWIVLLPVARAAVCDPNNFQGPYGFLLTGTATIGNAPRPAAAGGRLVLDGSGKLSGVASTNFTGLYLGNPVTGTYEAHNDCSVSWDLQDDSGNFQHFQGTMSGDGSRITFRQTDAGGARNGTMLRTADSCTAASFRGNYRLTASGNTFDVDTGSISGAIAVRGLLTADGAGNVAFSPATQFAPAPVGTYEFEEGCLVHLAMELAAGDNETALMNFRGVLVNGGREVIGIQTDPGTTVSLHLVRTAPFSEPPAALSSEPRP